MTVIKRSFLKNFLFALLVLITSSVVLEMIFRLTRPDDALKLSMGQVDRTYHHSLTPNSILHLVSSVPGEYDVFAHINQFGFRGPNFQQGKEPGLKRIFIVGDSFTFGVGAEDDATIPALMETYLHSAGTDWEVINAGRGHDSPINYYLRLRDELPKFSPDLVVLMLDFSDLWEDWNTEKNLIFDKAGNIVAIDPYYEYGTFKIWNFLRAKSVMCSYLHNKIVRTAQKIQKLGLKEYVSARLRGERIKAVIATTKEGTIAFDGRLFMRGREKADEITEHFKRTGKYILMCQKLAQNLNIPFILVMYPYGVHVGPDQWDEGRVFWGFERGKIYEDRFSFDLVEQFAREHHIPFINLLDDFIRARHEQLYFSYDGHFTPRANRLAAEALVHHPVFEKISAQL